jgi:hypothetical protein
MAFGAIGIFTRMNPAIADILLNNERSMRSCEQMLSALVSNYADPDRSFENQKAFLQALNNAQSNITEPREDEILKQIREVYSRAFADDQQAIFITRQKILELSEVNRQAMHKAHGRALQLGNGGAWGIVFMAISVFIAGLIFIKNLNHRLLEPVEELQSVLQAHQKGEMQRRCTGLNLPKDINAIFNGLNNILDKNMKDSYSKDIDKN